MHAKRAEIFIFGSPPAHSAMNYLSRTPNSSFKTVPGVPGGKINSKEMKTNRMAYLSNARRVAANFDFEQYIRAVLDLSKMYGSITIQKHGIGQISRIPLVS